MPYNPDTNEFEFSCGCRFRVLSTDPLALEFNPQSDSSGDILPINTKINVNKPIKRLGEQDDPDDCFVHIDNIPLDCQLTWDLISEGNTKGVFQLETRLGQMSAKKLRPRNIEHLAALGAIMRPGCLEAKRDGKSVTDHYIDRKNGDEPVEYFHEALEPILAPTYGEMIYQEQAMQIAQAVAGFDLQQADVLRKAIGKKKADVMAAVKGEFLEGCEKTGILTQEEAEIVFGWIEKSQRYSFNKSHSVAYAINGYLSAFIKAHFKESFFVSWLFYAKDKQKPFDEIRLLINVAKMMDVEVMPPDFRNDNNYFKRVGKIVYFGFCNIKGIGESGMNKIREAIFTAEAALGKHRKDWSWLDFLTFFSQNVSSTSIMGMIEAGALDYFRVPRARMAYEYETYSNLTKKEQVWFQNRENAVVWTRLENPSLENMLVAGGIASTKYQNATTKEKKSMNKGPCANKNRVQKLRDLIGLLKNPPHSLDDTAQWIARIEEAKLGIPLTACLVDDCKDASYANCTCEGFRKHQERTSGIFIAAQIDEVKLHITTGGRNPGQEMAFIEFSDNTSSVNGVIFPDAWEDIKLSGVCVPENTVMISGERGRERDSFIVKKISQLS